MLPQHRAATKKLSANLFTKQDFAFMATNETFCVITMSVLLKHEIHDGHRKKNCLDVSSAQQSILF